MSTVPFPPLSDPELLTVYLNAQGFLYTPARWAQKRAARFDEAQNIASCCIRGALDLASGRTPYTQFNYPLYAAFIADAGIDGEFTWASPDSYLERWNDLPNRSYQEVKAAVDQAVSTVQARVRARVEAAK